MIHVFDVLAVVKGIESNEVFGKFDDVMVFAGKSEKDDDVEDDGSLHVTRFGVRFCVGLPSDFSESKLNSHLKKLSKLIDKLIADN